MKKQLSWKLVALYTIILLVVFQVAKIIYRLSLSPEMAALDRSRHQRPQVEGLGERLSSLL